MADVIDEEGVSIGPTVQIPHGVKVIREERSLKPVPGTLLCREAKAIRNSQEK